MNDPSMPAQAGVTPCPDCGSTASIIQTENGHVKSIRRICCGVDPFWQSEAGRAWFKMHGVDLHAFAAREAARYACA